MNNNNKRHKNNLNHLYIHLKFMKVETSLLQPTKRKMNSQNNKKFMNTPSETLSDEENEAIFALLGSKCLTLSTAVVEIFTTVSPSHSKYLNKLSGIACFVRDSNVRSYFIRLYCLTKHKLIYEEEMYISIKLSQPKPFLICFEGKKCMVAINFLSESSAKHFYEIALKLTTSSTNKYTKDLIEKINKKSALKKRKVKKCDISSPSNYFHLVHVGFNQEIDRRLNDEESENLNNFLNEAGITEKHLSDSDTRESIYDFIRENNVVDELNVKISRSAPPPPSAGCSASLPRNNKISGRSLPPIPTNSGSVPLPPPLPPMIPLLSSNSSPEINLSQTLPRPKPSVRDPVIDGRDAFLKQIQEGKSLRKAKIVKQKKNPFISDTNDIMFALHKALLARKEQLQMSDEEKTQAEEDDWVD